MHLLRVTVALFVCTPLLRADLEKDVRDACDRLVAAAGAADQLTPASGYSWESMTGDPTPAVRDESYTVTTANGTKTHRSHAEGITQQPSVKGRIYANGDVYTVVTMPSGVVSQGIRRADGAAVVLFGEEWRDYNELRTELGLGTTGGGSRRGPPDPQKMALITGLSGSHPPPSIELPRLLEYIASYREENGEIVGELTVDGAAHMMFAPMVTTVTEAKGTITFHLSHGLLRQYIVRASGTREQPGSLTAPGGTFLVPSRTEHIVTIDYSGTVGPGELPQAALAKLDSIPSQRRTRPHPVTEKGKDEKPEQVAAQKSSASASPGTGAKSTETATGPQKDTP